MKKLLLLLLALPAVLLVACDDDADKLPPVDINVSVSGCTVVDGEIYVLQSDGFTIDSVSLVNHGTKRALIGAVTYFWDYAPVGSTPENPFSYRIVFPLDEVGTHVFQVECSIFAIDYAPAIGLLSYKVHVVESAADIPGGEAADGTAYELACRITSADNSIE